MNTTWRHGRGDSGGSRFVDIELPERCPEPRWVREESGDGLRCSEAVVVLRGTLDFRLRRVEDGAPIDAALSDHVYSTVVHGEVLLIGARNKARQDVLAAVDLLTGEVLWETPVAWRPWRLAVAGDRLLVLSQRELSQYGLHMFAVGVGVRPPVLVWERPDAAVYGALMSRDGAQLLTYRGGIQRLDAHLGQTIGQHDAKEGRFILDDQGFAYLDPPTTRVFGASGEQLWTVDDPDYNGHIDGEYRSTYVRGYSPMALSPTHLFVGQVGSSRSSGWFSGKPTAFDRQTGARTPIRGVRYGRAVYAFVTRREALMIEFGELTAVRLEGEETRPLWTWRADEKDHVRDVAVCAGRLFIVTYKKLYALDLSVDHPTT